MQLWVHQSTIPPFFFFKSFFTKTLIMNLSRTRAAHPSFQRRSLSRWWQPLIYCLQNAIGEACSWGSGINSCQNFEKILFCARSLIISSRKRHCYSEVIIFFLYVGIFVVFVGKLVLFFDSSRNVFFLMIVFWKIEITQRIYSWETPRLRFFKELKLHV